MNSQVLLALYLYLANLFSSVVPVTDFRISHAVVAHVEGSHLRRYKSALSAAAQNTPRMNPAKKPILPPTSGASLSKSGTSEQQSKSADTKGSNSHLSKDTRPAEVEWVIFVVHGVGGTDADLEKSAEEFRHALDSAKNSLSGGKVTHPSDSPHAPTTHVELINWKKKVADEQQSLLAPLKPESRGDVGKYRDMVNSAAADILFYMSNARKSAILQDVKKQLNSMHTKLVSDNRFASVRIAVVGYSLGSMIVSDILSTSDDLKFPVSALFLWGSPLSAYKSLTEPSVPRLSLPFKLRYFNIMHPHDPLAFRQDALVHQAPPRPPVPLGHGRDGALKEGVGVGGPNQPVDFLLHATAAPGGPLAAVHMLQAHLGYWSNPDVALFILIQLAAAETHH